MNLLGHLLALVAITTSFSLLTWSRLWKTDDQQGKSLFQEQRYSEAAEVFQDPLWQGTAWYRAGEFKKAEKAYARVPSALAEYNRGNCFIMMGKYEAAIHRFDRALELKPEWEDAEINRSIAELRMERTKREGGDLGDQKIGADEIRFDKNKNPGGQDTKVEAIQLSSQEVQAMWLRRVQTSPADFLRSKFAYQVSNSTSGETEP